MTPKWNPNSRESRLLQIAHVPGYLFREREVKVSGRLSNYVSTLENSSLKPKSVKKTEQEADLRYLYENPLDDPYVACICSEPNDLAAKTVAAALMLEAKRQGGNPIWHTLIGGYRDEMRDNYYRFNRYDYMVFANVTGNDTDAKVEKLRDLLEIYSDRPRIVTLTASEPIAFFNSIGYPLNRSLWIRGTRTTRVLGN